MPLLAGVALVWFMFCVAVATVSSLDGWLGLLAGLAVGLLGLAGAGMRWWSRRWSPVARVGGVFLGVAVRVPGVLLLGLFGVTLGRFEPVRWWLWLLAAYLVTLATEMVEVWCEVRALQTDAAARRERVQAEVRAGSSVGRTP